MSPGFSLRSNYGHREKRPWSWVMLQRRETGVKSWRLNSAVYVFLFKGKYLSAETLFFVCCLKPLSLRIVELKFSVAHFHFRGASSWNSVQLLGTELTKYFKHSSASPAFLLNSDILEMVSFLPLLLLFLLHISGGFRSSCRPSNMVFEYPSTTHTSCWHQNQPSAAQHYLGKWMSLLPLITNGAGDLCQLKRCLTLQYCLSSRRFLFYLLIFYYSRITLIGTCWWKQNRICWGPYSSTPAQVVQIPCSGMCPLKSRDLPNC